jgi:hypothetical protein
VSRGTLEYTQAYSAFCLQDFYLLRWAFPDLFNYAFPAFFEYIRNPRHSILKIILWLDLFLSTKLSAGFGLFPFRSPLLGESSFLSFPQGT